MIIEFFGPPSAGKTTLALTVTDQLRTQGYKVADHFSLRPFERQPTAFDGESPLRLLLKPVLSRVGRPFGQILNSARSLSRRDLQVLRDFFGALPPRSLLASLRLAQYFLRLEAEWNAAAGSGEIALFDQAYVQFICSLVLHSNRSDGARLAHVLSISPEPDILILVDAPEETLERRLQQRLRQQSFFERLLEFDMKTNLASTRVIGEIAELLTQQGRSFTRVSSIGPAAFRTILDSIASQLPPPRFRKPVQTWCSAPNETV